MICENIEKLFPFPSSRALLDLVKLAWLEVSIC